MNREDAHKFFSADCFNQVWDLLEKEGRTKDDNRLMREMTHASVFHWLSRDDLTPTNLSVGFWQVSRVYSVLQQPAEAMTYAKECIDVSEENALPPFYRGYAYEAAARAAHVAGDEKARDEFVQKASHLLNEIADAGEKKVLGADLVDFSE